MIVGRDRYMGDAGWLAGYGQAVNSGSFTSSTQFHAKPTLVPNWSGWQRLTSSSSAKLVLLSFLPEMRDETRGVGCAGLSQLVTH